VTNGRESIHPPNYKREAWEERASKEVCALPVYNEIDHDAQFVRITGLGDVVLEDLLGCMDDIVGQNAMGYPKLIDTRAAVGRFSDDDFMTLGARAQAYAFYDPRGPVAIVATSADSIENMRRFMNLAVGNRLIRLFVTVEEARAWLHERK
jgi:hypothetical protein